MCSCRGRPRSCTPTSTRSSRRSTSGTIPACAAGRSSSGRAWCSRRATRPRRYGVRTAMGGAPGPAPCPGAIVVSPRSRPTSRPARRSSRSSRHDAARRGAVDRRGVPRRRAASSGSRARRARSPSGCAARCARRSACRSPSGVARTKFLAKVASAVAKPDGLLVVPPDGELAFLHPLPVERLWGVGQDLREAALARDQDRRRRRRARAEDRWWRCSAGRRAASCTRWPTTTTRAWCETASGAARSARSRRIGRRPRTPEELDAILVAIVDRVTRRLRAAGPHRPHRRPAPALRRLHPDHPLPHPPAGHRSHADDPAHGALAARRRAAADRPPGPHPDRHGGGQSRERPALPAGPAAASGSGPSNWMRCSTSCASATARRRSRGRCW